MQLKYHVSRDIQVECTDLFLPALTDNQQPRGLKGVLFWPASSREPAQTPGKI